MYLLSPPLLYPLPSPGCSNTSCFTHDRGEQGRRHLLDATHDFHSFKESVNPNRLQFKNFQVKRPSKGRKPPSSPFMSRLGGGRKKELRHAINGSNAAARFNEAVIDARTVARLCRLSCKVQKENAALIGRSRY